MSKHRCTLYFSKKIPIKIIQPQESQPLQIPPGCFNNTAIFKMAFWACMLGLFDLQGSKAKGQTSLQTLAAMTADMQKKYLWACKPQNKEKPDPLSSMESVLFMLFHDKSRGSSSMQENGQCLTFLWQIFLIPTSAVEVIE